MRAQKKVKSLFRNSKKIKFNKNHKIKPWVIYAGVFAVIGLFMLFLSYAATAPNAKTAEAETGVSRVNATLVADTNASGGSFIEFGSQSNQTTTCADGPTISMNICLDQQSYPAPVVGISIPRQVQELNYGPIYSDGVGAFRTECSLSHTSKNDPIVYPGQRNAAHWHQFFGNTAVDENFTNAANIGNSTCAGGTLNRTAYWAPALIDTSSYDSATKTFDLAPVMTLSDGPQYSNPSTNGGGVAMQVYYKAGYNGVPSSVVEWFPPGLRMIAGGNPNVAPTGPPVAQLGPNPSYRNVYFDCISWGHAQSVWGTRGVDWDTDRIPANCPPGYYIQASVVFPQCGAVDAQGNPVLDSPNHRSHMSYPLGWPDLGCPSTHPRAYPEILEHFRWRVPASGAAGLRFSSDMYGTTPGWTFHADWWNGWDQATGNTIINSCYKATSNGSPPGLDCRINLTGGRHPNGGWWRLE